MFCGLATSSYYYHLLPLVPLNSFFKLKTFHKIKLRDMRGWRDRLKNCIFLSICCSSTIQSTRCYSSSEIYKIIIKRFSTVTANNFPSFNPTVQNERRKFSSGEKSNRIVTNSISTNWLRLNLFFFLFLSHSSFTHSLARSFIVWKIYIHSYVSFEKKVKKISNSSDNLLQMKLVDAITRRWFFHFYSFLCAFRCRSKKWKVHKWGKKPIFFVLLSQKERGREIKCECR